MVRADPSSRRSLHRCILIFGSRELSPLLLQLFAVLYCCRLSTEVRWIFLLWSYLPQESQPQILRSIREWPHSSAVFYFCSPFNWVLTFGGESVRMEWKVHQDSRSVLGLLLRHLKHRGYFWSGTSDTYICMSMWCWESMRKYLWEEHGKKHISPGEWPFSSSPIPTMPTTANFKNLIQYTILAATTAQNIAENIQSAFPWVNCCLSL
jgi:hypothetical protein